MIFSIVDNPKKVVMVCLKCHVETLSDFPFLSQSVSSLTSTSVSLDRGNQPSMQINNSNFARPEPNETESLTSESGLIEKLLPNIWPWLTKKSQSRSVTTIHAHLGPSQMFRQMPRISHRVCQSVVPLHRDMCCLFQQKHNMLLPDALQRRHVKSPLKSPLKPAITAACLREKKYRTAFQKLCNEIATENPAVMDCFCFRGRKKKESPRQTQSVTSCTGLFERKHPLGAVKEKQCVKM